MYKRQVSESGKARVTFQVPQYRGELRVMEVAASGKRSGSASVAVAVRDPLVVQTTLPRFLVAGDVAQVPVFVTNMSKAAQNVTLRLEAEDLPMAGVEQVLSPVPAIEFLGKPEGKLALADGASGTVVFQVKANRTVGAARLKVTVSAGKLESFETLEVPFTPGGPITRQVKTLELTSGMTDLSPYLKGWLPTSERTTFWVTGNPYGEAFDHLKYLVTYPHGCIEQTTSSTRPLLVVSNLLHNVDPALVARENIEKLVMHGVERVLSMQTPAGGFAYWPGSSEPVHWGTAYATHMLLDAQKLKYPVPRASLDEAVGWIEQELTHTIERTEAGSVDSRNKAEPYLQFVLAMAGKGRKARIQRIIDAIGPTTTGAPGNEERAEELYLLKAALYLSGDRRYERDLKQPDAAPLKADRKNSWSFYSDLRRRGLMLSVSIDLFGRQAGAEPLVALVARSLMGHQSGYYTTQELVWSITGLGRWVEAGAKQFKTPVMMVNGKKREPQAVSASARVSDRTWSLARASEYPSLTLTREGQEKVFLILASEGVRADGKYAIGGNGLKIERTFKRVDLDSVQVGDAALHMRQLGSELTKDEKVSGLVVDLRRTPGAVGPRVEQAYSDIAGAWEATAQRVSFLILEDAMQHMQITRIVSKAATRFGAVFTDRNEARTFVGSTDMGPNTAISKLWDRPSRMRR